MAGAITAIRFALQRMLSGSRTTRPRIEHRLGGFLSFIGPPIDHRDLKAAPEALLDG